ncbi:glycine cleavage system protein R [Nocardioides acrostichi]|uniref:Amino acid-binding ACT protein n=1 Tax=Nocardioides acrostichi TaxID=2784339 RepID=A0A930UYQ7_9ACTN|nr:ACT domain-containing protein [Nocardioides acrostichi]MBF4160844.1 amino acid-binding ACT protein [Nocardioides acrostichi]
MASLVLTVVGPDRAGLVSEVSRVVEAAGGSWQRSALARLAGTFAGVVLVDVPDRQRGALEATLAELGAQGLTVTVADDEGSPSDAHGTTWRLHLLGQDRPGIVAEISGALAVHGVGIDEIATQVREAPMAGGLLFEVEAVLSVPADLDESVVRSDLERVADELLVDLELDVSTD